MKGIILAAGFGTRFRPVTYRIPKPLLPLCNRPIIGYAIEAMLRSGVNEIAINLHHLPDALEEAVQAEYGKRCSLFFSREESILGTGGAIRRLAGWIGNDRDFVLVNGDTIQDPPLVEMIETHRRLGSLATLLLRVPPEGDRFTPVIVRDGRIFGFGEQSIAGDRMMFSGAHVISSAILGELPDRDFSGITEDVYFRIAGQGDGRLAAVVGEGMWFDVGSPARYLLAHRGVLAAMADGTVALPEGCALASNSLVERSATVTGTSEASAIGQRSQLDRDSVAKRSAIWSDVQLGAGAVVEDSIVCDGVRVPPGSSFARSLVMKDDPELDIPEGAERSDGLIVVPI